jgi:hypothetical protein
MSEVLHVPNTRSICARSEATPATVFISPL